MAFTIPFFVHPSVWTYVHLSDHQSMPLIFVMAGSLWLCYSTVPFLSVFNKIMIFVNREKLDLITRIAVCYPLFVLQNDSLIHLLTNKRWLILLQNESIFSRNSKPNHNCTTKDGFSGQCYGIQKLSLVHSCSYVASSDHGKMASMVTIKPWK